MEFKKGDIIVLLFEFENDNCYSKNYAYKVREGYTYLRTELDDGGCKINGWGYVGFSRQGELWRYATPSECKKYNSLNKPFNVFDTPYLRKLREKQERRDEVIKQSEIKHKVTLISI